MALTLQPSPGTTNVQSPSVKKQSPSVQKLANKLYTLRKVSIGILRFLT